MIGVDAAVAGAVHGVAAGHGGISFRVTVAPDPVSSSKSRSPLPVIPALCDATAIGMDSVVLGATLV